MGHRPGWEYSSWFTESSLTKEGNISVSILQWYCCKAIISFQRATAFLKWATLPLALSLADFEVYHYSPRSLGFLQEMVVTASVLKLLGNIRLTFRESFNAVSNYFKWVRLSSEHVAASRHNYPRIFQVVSSLTNGNMPVQLFTIVTQNFTNFSCKTLVSWRNLLFSLSENVRALPLFFFHSFKITHQLLSSYSRRCWLFLRWWVFSTWSHLRYIHPCPSSILIYIVPIYCDIQENSS